MRRLGIESTKAKKQVQWILDHKYLHLESIMSHFSESEDTQSTKTAEQINQLKLLIDTFSIPISCANSGAILFHKDKQFDWVRAGLALYGINPSQSETPVTTSLQPAMTFKSKVIAVKNVLLVKRLVIIVSGKH